MPCFNTYARISALMDENDTDVRRPLETQAIEKMRQSEGPCNYVWKTLATFK